MLLKALLKKKLKNINTLHISNKPEYLNKTPFQILNMRKLQPKVMNAKIIHFILMFSFLIKITILHVTQAACSYYDVTYA